MLLTEVQEWHRRDCYRREVCRHWEDFRDAAILSIQCRGLGKPEGVRG